MQVRERRTKGGEKVTSDISHQPLVILAGGTATIE